MHNKNGYCVLVEYVKDKWLIAPLEGENEYVFETWGEADDYAKETLPKETIKIVPFRDRRKIPEL